MKTYTKPTFTSVAKNSWAIVGISLAATIIYLAFGRLSDLVVPLIVALVVGALFAPVVGKLSKYMPRQIASAIVLIGLVAVSVGSVYVVATSLTEQAPALQRQLSDGFEQSRRYLLEFGVDIGTSRELTTKIEDFARSSSDSANFGSVLGSGFSVVGGVLTGSVIALFILYYVLSDWKQLIRWISSNLGVPKDLAEGAINDSVLSLRQYFSALTFTSFLVSIVIGVVAAVMGIPSAFAIAIITFITSYIPYIGGLFAGAFAVIIALGSQGINSALILLAVIVFIQVLIQPILQNTKTSSELSIHPAVLFSSTIIGSTVAGMLGAVLSGPVTAMIIKINKRLETYSK